jgi:site-specific DNA-methyltransferase (adenine-specific)
LKKILDPFAGSASTLIACRELGRAVVGIENDRVYYEAARQRACRRYGHSNLRAT